MSGSRFMFGCFCVVFCGLVLNSILLMFKTIAVAELVDQAINLGHAEYYLDANHDKQFRWKTNCVRVEVGK